MAPCPVTKQHLANIRQGNDETDKAYLNRVDKLILEGEPLGDEAKVLGGSRRPQN